MFEFGQRFGHICWHGDVDEASIIVPVQGKAKVTGAGPVLGKVIFVVQSGEKMIGVSFTEIFYTEVIHCKSEGRGSAIVFPKARSETNGSVAVRREVGFELVIRKDTGLFETVHSFSDFEIEISLGVEVIIGEMVSIDNFLGDISSMHAHILKDGHRGVEKEIFEIAGAVACTELRIGNCAV